MLLPSIGKCWIKFYMFLMLSLIHISFFQALKNFIVINQSPMSIVDDYFIAYFCVFCNQQIDFLVKGVIGDYIV